MVLHGTTKPREFGHPLMRTVKKGMKERGIKTNIEHPENLDFDNKCEMISKSSKWVYWCLHVTCLGSMIFKHQNNT